MDEYTIRAYAKVNLGLDVVKRLPNGYHQVKMIMQSIDLWDELTLQKTESGITITADSGRSPNKRPSANALSADNGRMSPIENRSSADNDGLSPIENQLSAADSVLPLDKSNLIYKAAALMFEKCGICQGVSIRLQKNIPIAAGMAGGSTDAAATMKGICRLFDLDLSLEQLMDYGVAIGADVPYCLMGGTALAEGIGEKLTPLPPMPDCLILAAKPEAGISTKYVYEHLDAQGLSSHPDIDGMTEAIRLQNLQGILDRMENVLETVTVPAYPVIDTLKTRMLQLGASASLMSGSGPTVFGIFLPEQKEIAGAALHIIQQEALAKQAYLVRPVSALPS